MSAWKVDIEIPVVHISWNPFGFTVAMLSLSPPPSASQVLASLPPWPPCRAKAHIFLKYWQHLIMMKSEIKQIVTQGFVMDPLCLVDFEEEPTQRRMTLIHTDVMIG